VLVELSPVQVNLFDLDVKRQAAVTTGQNGQELIGAGEEEEEFISFVEGDEQLRDNEKVEKEWRFDAG
jgi:hypothetical protein